MADLDQISRSIGFLENEVRRSREDHVRTNLKLDKIDERVESLLRTRERAIGASAVVATIISGAGVVAGWFFGKPG